MTRYEDFMALLRAPQLIRRSEFLTKHCPVPKTDGIYGWFIDDVIPGLDTSQCHRVDGRPLLYVGIARKDESSDPRKRHVRDRIGEHFNGNGAGSTLRLSLGSLLGIELRQVGGRKPVIDKKTGQPKLKRNGDPVLSKPRWVFANGGELRLDEWMEEHAFVTCLPMERPWEIEPLVFRSGLHLPINIDDHQGRGCFVSEAREKATERAKALAWIPESSGREIMKEAA